MSLEDRLDEARALIDRELDDLTSLRADLTRFNFFFFFDFTCIPEHVCNTKAGRSRGFDRSVRKPKAHAPNAPQASSRTTLKVARFDLYLVDATGGNQWTRVSEPAQRHWDEQGKNGC